MAIYIFKGNIIFYDAGALYYIADKTKDFLMYVCTNSNRLLRAVLEDLKVSEFLAGCRALGLISKIITSPLWRVLESDISILDKNEKYSHMIQCMERWAQNAEALTGTAVVFEDTPIKKDEIWEALTKSAENDTVGAEE